MILMLSLLMGWFSKKFLGLQGWPSFIPVLILAALILWGSMFAAQRDTHCPQPRWLVWLVLGAALLRLLIGVFWFNALPAWGYGSTIEKAGYVMADAHLRDTAAWKLAESSDSLFKAFSGQKMGDQYGGMIFLSALIYRYIGSGIHQPLLILVLTASFSAIAVLFTWSFVYRLWGERNAKIAAWIVALYPEAILLGSSQMREAFTMTLTVMAFYGLVCYWQDRSWSSLGWVIGAVGACLFFSPPIVILLLAMIVVQLLFQANYNILRQKRLWLVLGGLAIVAVIGVWVSWSRIAPKGINNPVALVSWWVEQTARLQAYYAKTSSTLIRKIFKQTPAWTHLVILSGYGVLQPFLPAAIIDRSAPIWQGIAIWRSLGWTILLPFLLYAPIMVWKKSNSSFVDSNHPWIKALSIIVWLSIIIPAFRSGGDQWDNPRYRVIFIGLQAALAAWVIVENSHRPDPWLRRSGIALIILLAWFIPWYMQRYVGFAWPVTDVFRSIGLGITSTVLYFIWDWARATRYEN
jgi:hypothetical protein